MLHPFALAFPLLLAPAAFADTLTVGPTGSGADFDEITDAVAAAQPGDTVLVAAGQYQDFASIVIDKPLTLIGEGSDVTSYTSLPSSPTSTPVPLLVTGIPTGQSVRVVGLELSAGSFGGIVASAFVVQHCDGPVALVDVRTLGAPSPFLAGIVGYSNVSDSAQVTLQDCSLVVSAAQSVAPGAALQILDSTVFLADCELQGGSSGISFGGTPVYDGSPGLVVDNSTVRLARTEVEGGHGAVDSPFGAPETVTSGGPAILAENAFVYVRGGAGNLLRGGLGGYAEPGGQPAFGPGGPALSLSAGTLATATSDVVAESGQDGLPTTTPVVEGAGDVVLLDVELATLGVADALVAPGATATFELGGAPGATALTFAALFEVPAKTYSGILGPSVLPGGAKLTLPVRVLDGAGLASLAVPLPTGPELVGLTPVVQTFTVDGVGNVSASTPGLFAIR